ncbi:hypothetical protein GCM10022222_31250 [Amycolatopsis ultiminotia]|uniref:Uncharacterized protein n=1 Tax=Amycolatopsis ultiminotia TaxID=543629 RepID=A0ABP6W4H4_9PSEU
MPGPGVRVLLQGRDGAAGWRHPDSNARVTGNIIPPVWFRHTPLPARLWGGGPSALTEAGRPNRTQT